ncbi:MAG: tetratricopeptide repeat protein [Epsilonproteobacteria bacterium]|nr:hypothetical protein [Campylobacterota bacterium]NPA57530.1 tetratricopeptide repeat protein [Campylobacterota bacterium]
MDRDELLREAADAFMKRDFQRALDNYLAVLRIDPEDREAQMGVMLCDLLGDNEQEALALFDYYQVLKEEGEGEAEKIIMEMIRDFDELESEILQMVLSHERSLDGISYEDFKSFVKERGDFKKAYEDIMFSTKVIITEKEDLFDFINTLMRHGYSDHVLRYLEDASKLYPTDRRLQEISKKLKP